MKKLIQENNKKWLLVGKGPSIDLWKESFLEEYQVIAINEVATLINASIVHISDYERFTNANYNKNIKIIMPTTPNWRYEEKSGDLLEYLKYDYKLREFAENEQIYSYDKTNIDSSWFKEEKKYRAEYASGVVLIDIITDITHCDKIYTLGIDGGSNYFNIFGKCDQPKNLYNAQLKVMEEIAENRKCQIISLKNSYFL